MLYVNFPSHQTFRPQNRKRRHKPLKRHKTDSQMAPRFSPAGSRGPRPSVATFRSLVEAPHDVTGARRPSSPRRSPGKPKPGCHNKNLILSLSKDDPVGGAVRACWSVLRQAQDEESRDRLGSYGRPENPLQALEKAQNRLGPRSGRREAAGRAPRRRRPGASSVRRRVTGARRPPGRSGRPENPSRAAMTGPHPEPVEG